MFTQSRAKVTTNPLRKTLIQKGYSVRAAARALGMLPSSLVAQLDAHDKKLDLPGRIEALPPVHKPPRKRYRSKAKPKE